MDWLYGRNSVYEALRARRRRVHRLLLGQGSRGMDRLIAFARSGDIPTQTLDRHHLDNLVGQHHQGVVAEADPFPYARLEDLLNPSAAPLLLALDSLQDPQNFGTLLRTARAVGVTGVLIPEHRAVAVTPAVSNASAGAVEHLDVARVTNLTRSLMHLKARNVWVYGLATDAPRPYWQADLTGPLAVVVGSEGEGLSRLVRDTCDLVLSIPMQADSIESLNASVAGSLVLYEAFLQRQHGYPARRA